MTLSLREFSRQIVHLLLGLLLTAIVYFFGKYNPPFICWRCGYLSEKTVNCDSQTAIESLGCIPAIQQSHMDTREGGNIE